MSQDVGLHKFHCIIIRIIELYDNLMVFVTLWKSWDFWFSDLQMKYYFILSNRLTNLIKIRSFTCSPLLIRHRVGDLKKPHYRSHANDPMYHLVKMASARLFCMLWAIWLVKKGPICIYHDVTYSWHKVSHMWPVLGFPQISHNVRDVILIRLPLDIYLLTYFVMRHIAQELPSNSG